MDFFSSELGIGTIVNHAGEGAVSLPADAAAHVTPIFQSSTFRYPDIASLTRAFRGEEKGFIYTRIGNPNQDQLARKIAFLEGLDLVRGRRRAEEGKPAGFLADELDEIVSGQLFGSGMAAVSAAIMGRVKTGEVMLAQRALYGGTYRFLANLAPRMGFQVVWVEDVSPAGWEAALGAHPEAVLVYAESPINPTMAIVDLQAVAAAAHQHGAWLMVDNTFATPYCQRPLALGADIVVHSTTKYLSGHGVIIGGALVSPHRRFITGEIQTIMKAIGASASPFDAWLANLGLKTFELRMARHCDNAEAVAQFLTGHPRVRQVNYPGLENHPGYETACAQMARFGGMLSFELEGGVEAARAFIDKLQLATLVGSLGNVDTLVAHPATMSHASVPAETRRKMGIADGLVRLSVGIENAPDIIVDLDRALSSG